MAKPKNKVRLKKKNKKKQRSTKWRGKRISAASKQLAGTELLVEQLLLSLQNGFDNNLDTLDKLVNGGFYKRPTEHEAFRAIFEKIVEKGVTLEKEMLPYNTPPDLSKHKLCCVDIVF